VNKRIECIGYDSHGNKCHNQAINLYCSFCDPSREEFRNGAKPLWINRSGGNSVSHHSTSQLVLRKPRKRKQESLWEGTEWEGTDVDLLSYEFDYGYNGQSTKTYSAPKPKPIQLKVGEYRIIDWVDPKFSKPDFKPAKAPRFFIPCTSYIVLRTSKGYRAVYLGYCGTTRRTGKPNSNLPLFQHHWYGPFKTFRAAEDVFYKGSESPYRVRERIRRVSDPNWIPPNLRALAAAGRFDLIPAKDKERLEKWVKAGLPGWYGSPLE
jgi:hypothetical protein